MRDAYDGKIVFHLSVQQGKYLKRLTHFVDIESELRIQGDRWLGAFPEGGKEITRVFGTIRT